MGVFCKSTSFELDNGTQSVLMQYINTKSKSLLTSPNMQKDSKDTFLSDLTNGGKVSKQHITAVHS